jgi:shikimate kinase
MDYSTVSLIGFMGSGKSSVGALLATQLGFRFIDLDAMLVSQSGYSSIGEIFTTLGEPRFRELESEIVCQIADTERTVFATGGGIIGQPRNMTALKKHGGICILLLVSLAEVLRRIPNAYNRPLLRDARFAEKLFVERQPIYQSYADLSVDTEGKSVEHICSEIVSLLNRRTRE